MDLLQDGGIGHKPVSKINGKFGKIDGENISAKIVMSVMSVMILIKCSPSCNYTFACYFCLVYFGLN